VSVRRFAQNRRSVVEIGVAALDELAREFVSASLRESSTNHHRRLTTARLFLRHESARKQLVFSNHFSLDGDSEFGSDGPHRGSSRRRAMQRDEKSDTVVRLEERLTERYGVLLSQTQLASLLNRTPGGLRYSLPILPMFRRVGSVAAADASAGASTIRRPTSLESSPLRPPVTNTIVRAPRRQRYVVVDQKLIDDERLSIAARGLLVLVLSKPDDWEVHVNDLRRRCQLGRDATYGLLNELKEVGYVRYFEKRLANGRVAGGAYRFYEQPEDAERATPLPDLPEAEKPDPVFPDAVNQEAIPNTDKNLVTTTTTTVVSGGGSEDEQAEELIFPGGLVELERQQAAQCLGQLDVGLRQPVLDELAGIMKAGKIRASPLACLEGIVRRAKAGAFTPQLAPRIAHAREERRSNERALQRALAAPPKLDGRVHAAGRTETTARATAAVTAEQGMAPAVTRYVPTP
jgi:hypothetical protein